MRIPVGTITLSASDLTATFHGIDAIPTIELRQAFYRKDNNRVIITYELDLTAIIHPNEEIRKILNDLAEMQQAQLDALRLRNLRIEITEAS